MTGKEQIRNVWLKSKAWKPGTHWLSDHPAYKLKVTVDGDRGTLHFECHFIDVDTGKIAALTAGNLDVAKIDGKLADHELRRQHDRAEDLSTCRQDPSRTGHSSRCPKRRLLSPADDPLVRAVGRVPAGVHAKLLVAFVGTALLVVVVGRPRAPAPRAVQRAGGDPRDAPGAGRRLRQAPERRLPHASCSQRVEGDFFKVFPDEQREDAAQAAVRVDQAIRAPSQLLPASTFPTSLGFRPPPEDERFLRRIRATGDELSQVMQRSSRLTPSAARDVSPRRRRGPRDRPRPARRPSSRTPPRRRTNALIAQNASAYENSRNLFIGVAAGAIVLALLLGFVLSWSLIGPIQSIDSRLAAIASGDFSGHVDVTNRDELGALATNVNRMNDELSACTGSSRRRASTSRTSWPTCRTSCGRR